MTAEEKNFSVPVERVGPFEKLKRHIVEILRTSSLLSEINHLWPEGVDGREVLRSIDRAQKSITCAHNRSHSLSFIRDMLAADARCDDPDAVFVEAGCFKGGSSAQFSFVADALRRRFYLFDSFEGLPENSEEHAESVMGHSIEGWFEKGNFSGGLEEVKKNIARYGKPDCCEYMKGWFEDTMPTFNKPVLAAFVDVDLASSTKTCLKYLYPLLVPGGVICSQDGDFPLVIEVFKDRNFWESEVRAFPEPIIKGLGKKITTIVKPVDE